METKEITYEDIEKLLNKSYDLIYVDYRSNLDDSLESVAEAIRTQDWCHIDQNCDDWFWECQCDSLDFIAKELKDEIEKEFDITEEEAEELMEEHWENLRDVIMDRDESDPIKDLIRNTRDIVMFYDTGEEFYDGCLSDQDEVDKMCKQIKKALKIPLKETKWDNDIDMMIRQGDNGRLVIYFTGDINEMMHLSDKNVVEFTNPNIAIIDTWNGAGDNCQLVGHKFAIPFEIKNFFIDKEVKYSYTYEVCGMSTNWCDGTGISFRKKKTSAKKAKVNESYAEELAREKRYKETFEKGGCTPMDMDMRRHRNTYYLNEFPCGTHCPHCHTFWID
ncbi:MAG: hypothetical protein WA061_01815 [Microgenomates group bacterium]